MLDRLGIFGICIIIFTIGISIMIIIAILKIPKIAKYQRALLKINALRASKEGVDNRQIETILNETDLTILPDTSYRNEVLKWEIKNT